MTNFSDETTFENKIIKINSFRNLENLKFTSVKLKADFCWNFFLHIRTFDDFRDIVDDFKYIKSFPLETMKDPICGSRGDRKKTKPNLCLKFFWWISRRSTSFDGWKFFFQQKNLNFHVPCPVQHKHTLYMMKKLSNSNVFY